MYTSDSNYIYIHAALSFSQFLSIACESEEKFLSFTVNMEIACSIYVTRWKSIEKKPYTLQRVRCLFSFENLNERDFNVLYIDLHLIYENKWTWQRHESFTLTQVKRTTYPHKKVLFLLFYISYVEIEQRQEIFHCYTVNEE